MRAALVRAALRGALATAGLAACATDVQVIRYPEAAGVAARPEGCAVKLLDWYAAPQQGCVDLADVEYGDLGYARECGREQAEAAIRAEACRVGADTAVVRRIKDFQSNCYQARARLQRCERS